MVDSNSDTEFDGIHSYAMKIIIVGSSGGFLDLLSYLALKSQKYLLVNFQKYFVFVAFVVIFFFQLSAYFGSTFTNKHWICIVIRFII